MKTFQHIITLSLISVLVISTFSCRKILPNKITITIDSPTEAQTVENGETVSVKGKIEANREDLHQYTITLKNETTGANVIDVTNHVDSKSVTFDESWVNDVTAHSDMVLTIQAEDHDGNKETSTVNFHCHPL